ncbi:DUF2188 domain-containing protein [Bacillus sp. FSL K6-3431]|uniref:DUF2188 domain-containing protein n=1 Tax=Bacillus sp. FSL K6-3431 TaxID=2921500 RepID=UPI0030F61C80
MPWSKNNYPDSMKNLSDDVRNKAIEIANAVLRDNKEESRAISIGIAQARKYVEGDDYHRPEYHVRAENENWVLKKKDGKRAIKREDTKASLLEKAKEYVTDHEGVLIIYTENGDVSQRLYE